MILIGISLGIHYIILYVSIKKHLRREINEALRVKAWEKQCTDLLTGPIHFMSIFATGVWTRRLLSGKNYLVIL